ncbi:MAG TPA: hypothetical protein VMT68_12750 [Caulobacteraceae bacterium]|nr:hypothetical protein [Caulobacteraceae bacterium]
MTSEPLQDRSREVAYLETLRGLGRPQRTAGVFACLIGVIVMVLARYRFGGEPWLLWGGVAITATGWALFIYAVAQRLLWIRAHPFDPNAQEPSG